MSSAAIALGRRDRALGLIAQVTEVAFVPLRALMSVPSALFLAALTAMLLRHPDVQFYEIDRVAFGVLLLAVVGRAMVSGQALFLVERATLPMAALTLLALVSLIGQPFDHETGSLLASKFIVPFTLFHLARLVFSDEKRFRQFEIFAVVVLAYLSFTAIAFLVGTRELIVPRFILDESLGFHVDRARGPLLEAVANGVSLNILGLLAVHAYCRRSVRGATVALILGSVPIAILATMTRAVWLAFAGSVIALAFVSRNRTIIRACIALILVSIVGLAVVLGSTDLGGALVDRIEERGPVEYRAAVYAGGWQMFLERPLTGWGFHQMPGELPRFVRGYDEKVLYPTTRIWSFWSNSVCQGWPCICGSCGNCGVWGAGRFRNPRKPVFSMRTFIAYGRSCSASIGSTRPRW